MRISLGAPTPPPPGGLQSTPVVTTVDVPPELWITVGVLLSATVLGGIYLATRHWQKSKEHKK